MVRVAVAAVLLTLSVAASAHAAAPTGYGGWNPFICELQQAGFGGTGPNPAADPYCVEFDKRRQNVTQLGLVDFLLAEPARLATAGTKCFYFQRDHWRAAVVQDDDATKLYEWEGYYFIDQATGDAGAYVEGLNVNGRSVPLHAIPGVPREFSRWMGWGTVGGRTRNAIPINPACAERAAREPAAIYRPSPEGPHGAPSPGGASRAAKDARRNAVARRAAARRAAVRRAGRPA